jgi:hypothetical protein
LSLVPRPTYLFTLLLNRSNTNSYTRTARPVPNPGNVLGRLPKKEQASMSARDAYVAEAKQRLDEWSAEMDTLEANADKAKEDDKARYRELLVALRAKRQEGQNQLAAIQAATGDSWTAFKADSDRVWVAFKDSIDQFKSHFK